jgi:hypothetical protein
MGKRQTHLDKAIANIDEKIRALQLAREHLAEELDTRRQGTRKRASPRAAAPAENSTGHLVE